MELDLARMRHLLAVAAHGSISRAAEELNITQPALSRSIAGLETYCQFKLFERGRRGVVPTALGRTVIAEAEGVLRAARGLNCNIGLYGRGEAGQLSVGVGPLLASALLPPIAAQLLRTRPKLRFRAEIGLAQRRLEHLLADEVELVLGSSWQLLNNPAVVVEPAGSLPLVLSVRKDHPLANTPTLPLTELAGYPLASAAEVLPRVFSDDAGAFLCDNFHILRDVVLSSDCIGLSCSSLIEPYVASGAMVLLKPEGLELPSVDIALIRRAERTLSPSAQAFAAAVTELLKTTLD